jgi:hypothetical protein
VWATVAEFDSGQYPGTPGLWALAQSNQAVNSLAIEQNEESEEWETHILPRSLHDGHNQKSNDQ